MKKQPLSMCVLALVSLAEDIVVLLSLGFCDPRWRGWLLFSCDWFSRLEKWEKVT